jgi:hypothetical protein
MIVFALAVVMSGIASAAPAQDENSAYVTIPFAFFVGDDQLPAGQYLFEMPKMGGFAAGTMFRIRSTDGSICQYRLSNRIDGVRTDNDYHVTFNKYGDTYFLTSVRNSLVGAELRKSSLEKKTALQLGTSASGPTSVELKLKPTRAK